MLEKTFYDNSASAESFLNTETTMFTMVLWVNSKKKTNFLSIY